MRDVRPLSAEEFATALFAVERPVILTHTHPDGDTVGTAAALIEAGGVPPVFVSANLDGGEAHNREMMRAYRNQIFYMGHERAGE